MRKETRIFYINDRRSKYQTIIKRTPTFFDALQMLRPQLSKYKLIPQSPKTSSTIHYQEVNLQEQMKEQQLLYLLIKQGNRVIYLTLRPNQPIRREEKEPIRSLVAFVDLKMERNE